VRGGGGGVEGCISFGLDLNISEEGEGCWLFLAGFRLETGLEGGRIYREGGIWEGEKHLQASRRWPPGL